MKKKNSPKSKAAAGSPVDRGGPLEAPFPGVPAALDGTAAVVAAETLASEAAGAYPITPATNMGEGFAAAYAQGKPNAFGRRLIFFEPEGEHAAAGVTAGLSMVGLRSANFSAGQGLAYMHESLYAATGKRLTYVLNVACRAMTKQALNIHAGHDDYHAIDDSGFFQLFAKDAQSATDLNLIAHRVAELALNPGVCAMDGFLTSHVIETLRVPEPELVRRYLGDPSDLIECPTPAQRLMFGDQRRRIPELFDMDAPAMLGTVQNQDAYAQGVAAQRPFFFDHIAALTDRAMDEYHALTGRRYERAMGYRLDDAEYVLVGQGSIVANMAALVDWLRSERGLKVGLLDVVMFRPFPADLITRLLAGRKAATVLERVDQPLASDLPLVRELRAAVGQALENGRAKKGESPFPGVASYGPGDAPDFYSGVFGLGSRDTQPGDLLAAVENMLPGGKGRRRFYLGIDFVRDGTAIPGLQKRGRDLIAAYPHVGELALPRADNVDLMPDGALSLRIHSVGGWGAITTGKNLAVTLFELLGMHVKANPKYGSEKKGQPTLFYATFAREPIRLGCELSRVHVVLSPDPNVFGHSNPLAGLVDGGAFVIQWDDTTDALWKMLPTRAREEIRRRKIRLFHLDGFGIARAEASDVELQYRMQGASFQGAFFRAGPLMEREGLDEEHLMEAIHAQLQKKFGHKGESVVQDNLRIIRRGFDEVVEVDVGAMVDPEAAEAPSRSKRHLFTMGPGCPGSFSPIAARGRFYDDVGDVYAHGEEPIADPFAALSAMPAATTALRDMTSIRFEVPKLVPDKCTGCGQCWVQCPDSAIPGLVSEVPELVRLALRASTNGSAPEFLPDLVDELSAAVRTVLREGEFTTFADALRQGGERLIDDLDPARREVVRSEIADAARAVEDFPATRARAFFDVFERREEGTGGLLSITVNPATCKGCMLCVDVCPDGALVVEKQTPAVVEQLRASQRMWESLPDTPPRFLQVRDWERGIGVLHTMLLQKSVYGSMTGGDGSCMGCGEKTALHLVTSAIEASMQPRVAELVEKLDGLISRLDAKARLVLASGADLQDPPSEDVHVHLTEADLHRLGHITVLLRQLKDLRRRYESGRAHLAISNSTGCSSVWGSTWPYNPYPYPWVNHLFQDAPSVAIGIFEGFMRKMADGFAAVRKAELEIDDAYDPGVHGPFFEAFDWNQFTDEEFLLCPPVLAVGGDGAMLDIGFQNLSRLLASGKPLRAIMLDTQVYSNTGGQACTSGFLGQVSDMAEYGKAVHGKVEARKELSLIGIAHRGAFVLQSSQAAASHLLSGVLRGLHSRRPALFILHTPCMPEHIVPDDAAARQSRLAMEARAIPLLVYDPDKGDDLAQCLDLTGNPAMDQAWPPHQLTYLDDAGEEQTLELPLTTADWAATEGRFAKHFKPIPRHRWSDEQVPVHEYLAMGEDGRAGMQAFVWAIGQDRRLDRVAASSEMVRLSEERLALWHFLKQMAGKDVPAVVRDAVTREVKAQYELEVQRLRGEHEAAMGELQGNVARSVAHRMAEALLDRATADSPELAAAAHARLEEHRAGLEKGSAPASAGGGEAVRASVPASGGHGAAVAAAASGGGGATAAAASSAEDAEDEELNFDLPWIESEMCTTCNECTNLNDHMFAYNADKQAYIKDPRAGTYQELVLAAERCPPQAIHPGKPLDPTEPELDQWMERAALLH